MSTPSSEPGGPAVIAPQTADSRTGLKAGASSLIILLAGGLMMFAVSRAGPGSFGELPLLPPLDGDSRAGAESLTIAASSPPSSIGPGVVAPADEGPAYRVRGGPSASVVDQLTAALGISPRVDPVEGPFAVVTDRDSDRFLRVENAPGHPWQVMRGDPSCLNEPDSSVSSDGSITCPSSAGSAEPGQVSGSAPSSGSGADSGESTSEEQVRCQPVDCPQGRACAQVCPEPTPIASSAPVDLPDPKTAEARAQEVLDALGLEVARSTLSVAPDGRSWQVLAEVAVGGVPAVGMDTQLSIGEDAQVVAGSGMIPDVVLLGTYPLVTAEEALVRLQKMLSPNNQPQFDGREPAVGQLEPAVDEFASMPPVDQSVATGMRLVLLLQGIRGGAAGGAFLVPAFLIDASDGSVFTVPAAIDEHITPS